MALNAHLVASAVALSGGQFRTAEIKILLAPSTLGR